MPCWLRSAPRAATWIKVDESEYGRFSWVMDPEGNRLELWEPLRV